MNEVKQVIYITMNIFLIGVLFIKGSVNVKRQIVIKHWQLRL